MRRVLAWFGGMALLAACSGQAWAGYAAGKTAYEAGDYATALAEWTAGAKQGEGLSLFGLGLLYQSGQGVQADPVQAHVYYNIAEALGVPQGGPARDALGKLMTPEKLAEARAEAQQLMSSREFVDASQGQAQPAPAQQPAQQAAQQPAAAAAPAAAAGQQAAPAPQIALGKACEHVLTWQDRGSGGTRDVSLYDPTPASGQFALGGYIQGNYGQPSGCAVTVAPAAGAAGTAAALAPPARWEVVWEDRGTGANMDGSVWAAVPPSDEYLCLGDVGQTGYSPPRPPSYACVHRCLVREIPAGQPVWTDQGTGARTQVALYAVPGIGGFVAYAGGDVPRTLFDLDPSGAACGGR